MPSKSGPSTGNPPPNPATEPASTGLKRPELLAPAGDWECARAAVENGADAIYFGLERFNARMRAQNFTVAVLPKLMAYLHGRGVRGYVTFNTLVFTDELRDATSILRSIISAGVDAAIVQDAGICRLIRQLSPDFPIHASTQMTISSAAGVRFARELGCELVVLARECSIKEIKSIREATAIGAASLPLEVFVHGALCVAYSGQCLTSESLGGRSANRGECAQACRMPYDLISDGNLVPLGDRKYLLSPQDLAGLDVLPDLVAAGVSSLKIEGRLKSPEYVANITRIYRSALDSIAAPSEFDALRKQEQYDMEMSFSRGLHTGWFGGINNQELVHARFGKKRGVLLGTVTDIRSGRVCISREGPVKPGDGVVFDSGNPDQDEAGGRVFTVEESGANLWLGFDRERFDLARVAPGNKVWKTNDPALDKRVRQSFESESPLFKRPIHIETHGRIGTPLTLIVSDELGHTVQLESQLKLEAALHRPLTTQRLEEQLGRLGGSAYKLGSLSNKLEGDIILPVSELNRLRREAVVQLDALRSAPKRWTVSTAQAVDELLPQGPEYPVAPNQPELVVLARDLNQLNEVIALDVDTIYCEFEDPKKYRDAVGLFRKATGSNPAGKSIWVVPPRITKMGEEWILNQVRSSEPDGFLVRNYDHLEFFKGQRVRGDFPLNVANPWTASLFIKRHSLERVTASYDLSIRQLEALLSAAPPAWFDITIHQHMPMFHMEHCVFCAFLSKGTDYTNCGRPCDIHDVRLRDRTGVDHPLKADAGCRNTVYNGRAQTGAEFAAHLIKMGARFFRVDFLNENPAEVRQVIGLYRSLLRGETDGAELWRKLKAVNQLGVTRGQLGL